MVQKNRADPHTGNPVLSEKNPFFSLKDRTFLGYLFSQEIDILPKGHVEPNHLRWLLTGLFQDPGYWTAIFERMDAAKEGQEIFSGDQEALKKAEQRMFYK